MFTLRVKHILSLLFISIAIVGCQKQENEEAEVIDPQLDGEVIFEQGLHLKSANINLLNQTVSHGNANPDSYPKWSNDGTKFAYIFLEGDIDSTCFYLKIIDYNSGKTTDWKIGNSKYININRQLSWSPDDTTVIFLGKDSRQNTIIYLNTLTGDTIQTHFNLDINVYCTALAWNRSEEKIAVNIQNWHDFQSDNIIWMVEPYETNPVKQFQVKTNLGCGVEHLDWNFDGTKLLYSCGSYGDIFIVNKDGSENKDIPDITGIAPCWSIDGNFIMYTGISGYNGSMIIPGLFVTDINGTFEKLILKNAENPDWN